MGGQEMGLCLGFESALQYWLTKGEDEAVPESTDTGRFAQVTEQMRASPATSWMVGVK